MDGQYLICETNEMCTSTNETIQFLITPEKCDYQVYSLPMLLPVVLTLALLQLAATFFAGVTMILASWASRIPLHNSAQWLCQVW